VSVLVFSACSPTAVTHGVPNLAQVNAAVWRSGQITTRDGWEHVRQVTRAKRLHVLKLNFAAEGSDDLARALGLEVHVVSIEPQGDRDVWNDLQSTFTQPDPALVRQALELLSRATTEDVWLVHCTHGQDRTGLIVGMYRVLHEGWTKERAYAEMRAHHFHPALLGVYHAWREFKVPARAEESR
jgi:protein-tyrosine phosphatase